MTGDHSKILFTPGILKRIVILNQGIMDLPETIQTMQ
jgi:hypothetical protein